MKIKKQTNSNVKSVKASQLQPTTQVDFADITDVIEGADAYCIACNCIRDAIKSLSTVAETDIIAKESIANLAVVLLDLSN